MLAAAALLTCLAAPAAAQDANPNGGAITVTGALDFTNAYMFRGIKQESDGLIMQPYLDLGATLYKGEGSVKTFGLNVGTWNSLHASSPTGTDNPINHKLWYESDFYTTLSFGLSGGVTTGITYTAYTSPNDQFTTVKELAFKVSVDDSKQLKKWSLKPYGLIGSELDTSTHQGQADGGTKAGVYVELGIAPTYQTPYASIAVPVKVGLSMSNYYEKTSAALVAAGLGGEQSTFGFGSIAAIATHQLSKKPTKFGNWNVHVGVEYQGLGGTTKLMLGELKDGATDASNADNYKAYKFIYSGGLGFSY